MNTANMAHFGLDRNMWDSEIESGAEVTPRNPASVGCAHSMGMQTQHDGASKRTGRPWFKFYTRDFRDGVRVLSLEEVGAYTLVLSLIYETGGRLKDDERAVCAHLGCDIRVWRRVRLRLLEEGKLTVTNDGFLTNERASEEIASAEHLSEVRRTSGRSGGKQSGKSRAKPKADNETAEANASGLLDTEGRRQRADTLKDESLSDRADAGGLFGDASPEPPAKPKRTRAPQAFLATAETMPVDPPPVWVDAAVEVGMVNGTIAAQWSDFRRYHIASGTRFKRFGGSIATWLGNWRNAGCKQTHANAGVLIDAQGRPFKNVRHNPNR